MEIVNYEKFVNEILLSKKYFYNCETLSSISSLMIYDEIETENEDYFFKIFGDLVFYLSSTSCDDRVKFKQVIDDLVKIIESQREITRNDIHYILNKQEILRIISKYNSNVINKQILENQLKKYFKDENIDVIYSYLASQSIL